MDNEAHEYPRCMDRRKKITTGYKGNQTLACKMLMCMREIWNNACDINISNNANKPLRKQKELNKNFTELFV